MKRHQILPIQNHVTKRENGKTGKRHNGNEAADIHMPTAFYKFQTLCLHSHASKVNNITKI